MKPRRLLPLAGIALALTVRTGLAAECYKAAIASPLAGHYALGVDNQCKTPLALAVCWRWGSNAKVQNYRLSRPGSVTFLGPEVAEGSAATPTWLRCASGMCRIDCAPAIASAPAAPVPAPAQSPAKPPQQASLPPTPPPPRWGAMAAGIDAAETGGTGHAGVGWAIGDNEEAAQQAALAQCRKQGVSSCKIVDLYNEGCGYITTGNNRAGGYGWGTGATAERAVAVCASQGLSCQKPIGGCVR